jgi:hypothetical protein
MIRVQSEEDETMVSIEAISAHVLRSLPDDRSFSECDLCVGIAN